MTDTINEQWPNMTAWTLAEAGCLTASSNKVWGTAAAIPGAVRPFEPGAGNFRLVGSIVLQTGGTEGHYTLFGVSNTAGATETTGWFVIGIDGKGRASLYVGATPTLLGTGLTAGTYLVTVVGDANYVSFTLVKSDRSVELRIKKTRAEVGTVKRAVIYNADSRGASTGTSIAPLGGRLDLKTLETRTNIEGLGTSRAYSTVDAGGKAIRLEFPAAFDSAKPPLGWVLFSHGALESDLENTPIARAERAPMFKALLEAGYCIATSSFSGESTYGNLQTGKDFKELYDYVHANYLEAPIVIMGYSAGAAAAYLAIKQNLIPASALIAISGFANIEYFKEHRGEEPFAGFVPTFRTAYGVNEAFSNYTEKIITPELDPELWSFSVFRGLPVGLLASPEDTTVLKLQNADKIKEKLEGHQVFLKELATTGNHSTAGNFPTTATVTLIGEALEAHALSATLSVTQPQVASLVKTITRAPLTIAQPQVVTKRAALARALSTSQGQVGTFKRELARKLSTTQGEVPSVQRVLAKPLSAAQPQVVTKRAALARALSTSQGQVGTFKRELARKLSTTQGEVPSVQRVLAKPLSAAQPQVVTKRAALARALSTSQGQVSELGPRVLNRLLEVSQAQAATIVERVTKTFALGQPQVAKLRRFRRPEDVVPVPVISVIVTPTPAVTTVIITEPSVATILP